MISGGPRQCSTWTYFTKTRMRETAQIDRAAAAMARCQREGHTTDEGKEGRR